MARALIVHAIELVGAPRGSARAKHVRLPSSPPSGTCSSGQTGVASSSRAARALARSEGQLPFAGAVDLYDQWVLHAKKHAMALHTPTMSHPLWSREFDAAIYAILEEGSRARRRYAHQTAAR